MSYDYVQYLYNHVCCCQLRALHDFFRHVSTFLCQIRDLVTDVVHRARVLCSSLAIFLNMDFPQRVSKSRCHPVAVLILVMYVDNSGIRHNCEELAQEFEKFVVMAINPGADLDSLPILDNPDNFVVHAYAAFILELSYVALNNLPQLNSFKSYPSRSLFKATPVHLSFARFLAPLSTWYHRSQIFLVMKYRMLSSVNINAVCISSLSSSVYFNWAPDKNHRRSLMAYHLFAGQWCYTSEKYIAIHMLSNYLEYRSRAK